MTNDVMHSTQYKIRYKGAILYGSRERPLKIIKSEDSITKSNKSKLKLDFLSENFKFKLTKCKSHFHNWQFKSHQLTFQNCEFAVAKTQFSI